MNDLNIDMIQKAIETKTEIALYPRRSHVMKGIPVRYDSKIYRIYVDTGKDMCQSGLSILSALSVLTA